MLDWFSGCNQFLSLTTGRLVAVCSYFDPPSWRYAISGQLACIIPLSGMHDIVPGDFSKSVSVY